MELVHADRRRLRESVFRNVAWSQRFVRGTDHKKRKMTTLRKRRKDQNATTAV